MRNNINGEEIDYNIINLKCIDDINNKIGIVLESNINGMLKLLNINYIIDIPKSELFSKKEDNNNNNNDNNNNYLDDDIYYDNNSEIYKGNKYNKSMLFDPFE